MSADQAPGIRSGDETGSAGTTGPSEPAAGVQRVWASESVEARAIRVLRGFCDADEVDMILEGLRPLLVSDDTEHLVAIGRAVEDCCEMDATCADGVIPKPVLERMQAIRSAAGVQS